jgi:hypothetical protein
VGVFDTEVEGRGLFVVSVGVETREEGNEASQKSGK